MKRPGYEHSKTRVGRTQFVVELPISEERTYEEDHTTLTSYSCESSQTLNPGY